MDIHKNGGDKAQRAVQSVEVGGRLLLALAHRLEPKSLKDLAASAALPPSRAHPFLVNYGRLGLVSQDNATGRYALGPAALQLGLTALHQYDPVRAAGPVAEALAADTGQAVAIAVWGTFGPTVIRMIDARQPLHVTMRAGTVMSIFDTATGGAFAGVVRTERIAAALAGDALGANSPPVRSCKRGHSPHKAAVRARRAGQPWLCPGCGPPNPRRERIQRADFRPRW